MASVDAIVEAWKNKLIDLTRRNRLIYFKPSKASALRVIEPPLLEVFQRLVMADGKSWDFYIPESDDGESESDPHQSLAEISRGSLRRRRSNELVCRLRDDIEASDVGETHRTPSVRSVLRGLYRRSRTEAEERGITILHMVFGLLEWEEQDPVAIVRSPLLLVPVKLTPTQSVTPFKLSLADDELTLNPALEVKLQSVFNAALPTAPDDWEAESLDRYFDAVDKSVAPRHWKVIPECWLCTLSYHKLVMYQDLKKNAERIKKHFLPRNLSGEVIVDATNDALPTEPAELDKVLHPKNSYLILDADSSQLACIEAVKQGMNVVIQGPPGTGKSQTIANIIAEFIAAGKRVLFVSEKMAALKIVSDRLEEAKLDHYCLVLHSHKANKREVVKELARCFNEEQQPHGQLRASDLQKLTEVRETLNGYVNALNLKREGMGKSAFHMMGEYALLDGVPEVRLRHLHPVQFTYTFIERAVEMTNELTDFWHINAGFTSFPWRGCTIPQYGPQTRLLVEEILDRCVEAVNGLFDEADTLSNLIAQPQSILCLDELPHLCELVRLLQRGPGVPAAWVSDVNLDDLLTAVCAMSKHAQNYKQHRDDLLVRYNGGVFNLPIDFEEQLRRVTQEVETVIGSHFAKNDVLVRNRSAVRDWSHALEQGITDWLHEGEMLAHLLGQQTPKNIPDLKALLNLGLTTK